jgi:hypothetical protein
LQSLLSQLLTWIAWAGVTLEGLHCSRGEQLESLRIPLMPRPVGLPLEVTQLASNLAWHFSIANYREAEVLHTVSTAVDIGQVLWNPFAWTGVYLMTLMWGVSRRRSVLQTLALLTAMAAMFLLLSSLQTVWLLKGPPASP